MNGMAHQTCTFNTVGLETAPLALAHVVIYDRVIELLSTLPRGKVLDVPAGEGALGARLLEKGFEVHCCDLYPEIFRLKGTEMRQGDLMGTLPYEDGQFQYVTCVEGLEHLESPAQAIREFKRLLAPGGELIVSIPNILNIEERFKWLVHGYTSHFKPISKSYLEQVRRDHGAKEEIALHVHSISYSELRYQLEKNGFAIVKIFPDKPKRRIWMYWPALALIGLVKRLTPKAKRAERWIDELNSPEILKGGNTLIVHARKNEET